MKSFKVLITPRSFGKNSKEPFRSLEESGFEIVMNPFNRIMTQGEMASIISAYDAVILGVDPMNKSVLEKATKLKVISRYGVGLDNIDLEYAKELGIAVYRTVGANSNAVADYAFGLMLNVVRKINYIDKECRRGNWNKITTSEMWSKTIGIVGLGTIGKGMAKRAAGFNMKVLAYDTYKDEAYAKENNIEFVDLNTLLKSSDFISLHLPLMEETKNLISFDEFAMMKSNAVIVNTARGAVINEDALYTALKTRTILGAGIDVFDQEPPENKEIVELDNIVIGSHCAASSVEAIDNMSIFSVENLVNHFKK